MDQMSSRVVILEGYTAQYGDPIAFRAGETVDVRRADPDFPEWFWCLASDGKEGWVHLSYLSQTTGQATAVRDYSAQELTIAAVEYLRSGTLRKERSALRTVRRCRPKERVRNYEEA